MKTFFRRVYRSMSCERSIFQVVFQTAFFKSQILMSQNEKNSTFFKSILFDCDNMRDIID